jgi:two-component system NtrC family response regulator
MVAESEAMQEVLALADRVAASTAPVLITGESGVGKELIARRLHSRSGRSAGPFVAVNCAAIPSELLESELFGHTRGAYTGASRAREGRFRRANGGTLFLDEVAEIPPAIQVKLLRVLQEGEVDVVGSDQPVQVDVRVVAATNQDIAARVSDGAFRDDLYYRLNVIEVQVPPLRTRPEDIAPLARSFLSELAVGPELELPDDVLAELTRRPWRGNVRELRNACERLAILTPGGQVRVDDLPRPGLGSADDRWLELIPAGMGLIDVEREVIAHTLHRTRWNVSEAARLLGVPRHILTYRIDKHGLARGD